MSKVILITGCSTGFGRMTALLLAEKGNTVYATVRNEKDMRSLADSPNLIPVHMDVTWSQQKISHIINSLKHEIDVVINNAGYGMMGPSGDLTELELRNQFEVNFFGQFKVIQAVLPGMRKQQQGMIININSISGLITTAFYGAYSASKFALNAISMALRFEESVNGIHVVSVHPGSFNTDFWKNIHWTRSTPRLNAKIQRFITQVKWHRGNPNRVMHTLVRIVESRDPRKRYFVGFEAYLIYYFFTLVPNFIIDWLCKRAVRRFRT